MTSSYRLPPDPIPQILDAPPTPALVLSPDRRELAMLGRPNLPAIADFAQPELRLAGLRIDPRTGGPSRQTYFHSLAFRALEGGEERSAALPAGARIGYPRWSPDGRWLAFTHTTSDEIQLWVAEAATGRSRYLIGDLNATLGMPYAWLPGSEALLVYRRLGSRGPAPAAPEVPGGPVVQENLGSVAPNRTYEDLLQGPHDERLFEYHVSGRLARVPVHGGEPEALGEPGIVRDFSPSPDGRWLLVETLHRPFSYVVPAHRFPTRSEVLDDAGRPVRTVADLPLAEEVPVAFDAVREGPRGMHWRSDAPATLAWAEALDGGDPRVAAEARDRVVQLAAPFDAEPAALLTLEHRFAGVQWGRGDFAIVYSHWWITRNERRWAVSPDDPAAPPRLLSDRSYQDRYGDPGRPAMQRTPAGGMALLFTPDGRALHLAGAGASPAGSYPFLDRWEPETGETTRVWRARDPYYEEVVAVLDPAAQRILTRREAADEPPNFYIRELPAGTATAITDFPDPAPQLAGIRRQLLSYERADGVKLSATLYLPPGYDAERDGPLPLLVWAYPREFRDANAAGQLDDSPNRFSRPAGASHLFLLTQGYAILDGPAMPIIGEGDAEPNDTYVEQLVEDARAAVEKVVSMGVADRERIAVGGHSYGAFMAANLLAHSDLFAAGIARSGAYNRTLTPFGFQQEQRTYWEAPGTYNRMSPFAHAHRIRHPLLLIHGEADENSGTFPIQTERFYAALKGHGATARYVVLPLETHGYRARESVLHAVAEMVDWMDRWVKRGGG